MANGRQNIAPPVFTPLRYGLLSVATDASASAPEHWQAGVTWQSHCPDGDGTYDECVASLAIDGETEIAEPPVKVITTGFDLRGATPFTVYTRFDCSPIGFWDQANTLAVEALTRVEGNEVERIFASGVATSTGGSPVTVYPHLRATAEQVDDTGALLQPITEVITTEPVDIVEAVGRLEGALASCYYGQGVIHAPVRLMAEMTANTQVTRQGDQLLSPSGHRIALGSGYSGASPAGVVAEDVAWMYATGTVFYYRGEVKVTPVADNLDRSVNTVEAIAERTYIIGWDCCLLAIPVYAGGVMSGEFNSPGEFIGS